MANKKISIPAAHRLAHLASAPQVAAGPAGAQIGDLWIPDLSEFPQPVQKAHHLLTLASGIEHALLIQYLYVAYSVDANSAPPAVASSKRQIAQIAIEEMAHLMSVQNLLLLVRGEPTFKRTDRQQAEMESDRIVPFNLKLEPFSKDSIAKYVVAESPSNAAQIDPDFQTVEQIAGQAHMGTVKQVGVLYLLLGVVFGDEATLQQRADAGDEWSQNVKELADLIIEVDESNAADKPNFGGRAGMHLEDSDFAVVGDEFMSRQGMHSSWDRSPHHDDNADPFILTTPTDRGSALDLLRDIGLQGEAPAAPGAAGDKSHFERFFDGFKQVYGDDASGPEPDGVFKVPASSKIEVAENSTAAEAITNPTTVKWARLADLRYAILLGSLEQYMASPPHDRQFLEGWSFAEMFHLKKLGGFVSDMPRTNDAADGLKGSVPFNLPERFVADGTMSMNNVGGNTMWPPVIEEWFQEAIQIADELLPLIPAFEEQQRQLLTYMREVDQRKLEEAKARQSGQTVRTTFDEVREILDWAAGTGDPRENSSHGGHGRFWGQDLGILETSEIGGQPILDQLVPVLSMPPGQAFMPGGGRPKLNNPEHQDKIDRIAAWIAAGARDDQPVPTTGPVSDIKELRILPSLAIGRLGSSPEPMQNYTLEVEPDKDYRQIKSAETLIVNEMDGSIVLATIPSNVRFKDANGKVKPVAPFLELWAIFEDGGPLRPVTTAALEALGLNPSDVKWTARVANLKAFRRTGQPGDRIEATVSDISDHGSHDLRATAGNFKTSRSISLGSVRYIRPTNDFNEIRFRFTPAAGLVFGHMQDANIPAGQDVYDASSGGWDNHEDQINPASPTPRARITTAPGGIFATTGPPSRSNLGYLDDSCDGIVSVSLTVNGQERTASARIASGPPDFAPDSYPVRTVADEIEQVLHGPDVSTVTADEVIDILRRAFETVRAMSVERQNATFPFWEQGARNIFGNGLTYNNAIDTHKGLLAALEGLKAPATSPERAAAHGALTRVAGAVRAYDQVANYGNPGTTQQAGTRQMPALMRGADGDLLALNRRQRAKVMLAVETFRPQTAGGTPRDAMVRMIQSLQFAAGLHSQIDVGGNQTLQIIFGDSDQVLSYLEVGVVQGDDSIAAPFLGQPLIQAGQPDNSPFVTLISTQGHPMNGPLSSYSDPQTNENGIEVVRSWIASL